MKTNQHPLKVGLMIVCTAFALHSCAEEESKGSDKPNILIIYADDLGYGDLGIYGGDIPTPNIDRIGLEGIKFTDFYVSAPACTPSRFTLLTGSYPQRSKHGLWNVLMPHSANKHYIDASEKTIAEFLKSDGYKTAVFGKWHLGFPNENDMPDIYGFDEFAGHKGGCIDFFTHVYGEMGLDWYVDGKLTKEEGYSTDLITNHAIDFINRMSESTTPFFTYLAYNAPHYGKTDPDFITETTVILRDYHYQEYRVMNTLQAPPNYMEKFKHIPCQYRQAYSAMVSSMDDNIGRIISKLEEKNLLDNTIIWFISDNGGYSERYFGHADNGGLRGEKGSRWEGGIRVPALLKWKDKIAENQVISTPLINADVLPTLLSILKIPISDQELKVMDGADISPVLFQQKNLERPLYWMRGLHGETAIREGDWKLYDNKYLFNLKDDPNETVDLSEKYPEKVKYLSIKCDDFFQSIIDK